MRLFIFVSIIMAMMLLTNCASNQEQACQVPPHDRAHTILEWEFTQTEVDSLNPASQSGGVVKIGSNNSAASPKDGNAASKAKSTFPCGSEGKYCNVEFSVSAPFQARGGENMTVTFRYNDAAGKAKSRSMTFNNQPGEGKNPVQVALAGCGNVTVEVSGSAGETSHIQEKFSAGPFYFECAECAIKEKGTEGT